MSKHNTCECGLRRSYDNEHDAEKALGRVQTRRKRHADAQGTRRGLRMENRAFECSYGGWHLTATSRRQFTELVEVA